mgnify:CR=1 FL=1
MEVLYLLIPVSLVFVGLIAWVFLWAVRSGQFDDMEGPAHQILMDDDGPVSGQQSDEDADEDAGKPSSRPE